MSMRVLIIGAGGLGQMAADILLQSRKMADAIEPVGFVDDDSTLVGWQYLGLSVIGGVSALTHIPHDAALIAVSDNATRCHLYEQLARGGARFVTIRHSDAVVAPDVVIGPGTIVCAGAVIGHGATIGANSIVHSGSCVAYGSRLGNHVYIGPKAHLGGDVVVGEGAVIKANVTVLARRRIGAWSFIGAGSVVERDLPDGNAVNGAPVMPTEPEVGADGAMGCHELDRARCLRPIMR